MRLCDYYLTWLSLHSLCSSVLHVSQRQSEHVSRTPTAVPVIVIITHTCLAAARRRWGVWPRLMEGHKLLQAFSAKSRAIENPFIRHTHTHTPPPSAVIGPLNSTIHTRYHKNDTHIRRAIMTEVKSVFERPVFTTDIHSHIHTLFELPLAAIWKLRQLTCCLRSHCLIRQWGNVGTQNWFRT